MPKKGDKSVAVWICFTGSNEITQDVVLCQRCFEQHDEDHYLEEILY